MLLKCADPVEVGYREANSLIFLKKTCIVLQKNLIVLAWSVVLLYLFEHAIPFL
jgi:hypothetical protein